MNNIVFITCIIYIVLWFIIILISILESESQELQDEPPDYPHDELPKYTPTN